MPIRFIPVILFLVVGAYMTMRRALYGLYILIGMIFINPGSLLWAIDRFHLPMVFGIMTFTSSLKEKGNNRKYVSPPIQLYIFIIFLFFLSISAIVGEVPEKTYPSLKNWCTLFMLFFLIVSIVNTEMEVRKIWLIIVLVMSVLCFRGYAQYVRWGIVTGLPQSTMEDRNDFAMVLAMCIPLIYYFFRTETGVKKWMFFSMHALFIGLVLLTHSRMGFLLIVFYMSILFLQSNKKIRFLVLVVPVVIVAVSFAPESLVKRVDTIKSYEEDPSAVGRINAWRTGLNMMEENPITGVGLDSFDDRKIYFQYAVDQIPHVAHNSYVQIGAEAGIPALILYLLLIFSTAFQSIRLIRQSENMHDKLFYKMILLSLVIYCLGSIFLSAENRESLYILIGTVAARDYIRRNNTARNLLA